MLLGAGLLWFGWFGFNGGSGLAAGSSGVLAFTNTFLCPAATLVVWFTLDLLRGGKVTAIGAATAIIVGCVGITPAAGFISPGWALALGALAALPSYAFIVWRPRTRVDETLDVLAAHGMAGASPGSSSSGSSHSSPGTGSDDGLLYGNAAQLGHQAIAVLAAPAYAFVGDLRDPAGGRRVHAAAGDQNDEALGMDVSQHGEEAYLTGEGAILLTATPEEAELMTRAGR